MSKIPKLRFIKISVPDALTLIGYSTAWTEFIRSSSVPDPEFERALNELLAIRSRMQFRLDQVQHHE